MDAEPSTEKGIRPRRSRSHSSISQRSTEDSSSNADSNSSSVGKDVLPKDKELHNGAVGETESVDTEKAAESARESSGISTKREEKHVKKASHGGDLWKSHLDLSDSCSLSENEASDADGRSESASAATNLADANQVEEQNPEPATAADDEAAMDFVDDVSVSSDTSDFYGFETSAYDQSYIDALIQAINKSETKDDDCCSSFDHQGGSSSSVPASPKADSEYEPVAVPSTSRGTSSKKVYVDLSNPAYRKPLDMGWKREVVFRSTGDPLNSRCLLDIYYFSPSGKKARSKREVLENLEGTDLTLENFTFFKQPIGINDPGKEVIRDARRMPLPVKMLNAAVPEEADGLSESGSSDSTSRDQVPAPPADPAADAAHNIPPAVAGPSGINKTSRLQPYVRLSRSFPRIKVTSPRAARGGRQASSLRGGAAGRVSAGSSNISSSTGNMEMGMLPPMWKDKDGASTTKVLSSPGVASLQAAAARSAGKSGRGAKAGSPASWTHSGVSTKEAASETRKQKAFASPPEEAAVPSKRLRLDEDEARRSFMTRYMANVCDTHNVMLHVFEYLKVQELLRAARVCRIWRSIAMHKSLWQTVRLKNSHVADWKGCVASLERHGTRHLDMRKMLVPAGRGDEWWATFCANISRVPSLESVEFCRCPGAIVERVAQQCPQLTTLSALSIKDHCINLSSIGQLKNLKELRIKNLLGVYLNGNLDGLMELVNLKHLSLTMVKNLGRAGCGVLGSLQTLETLELGECCDLPPSFGDQTLSQLQSLQRLRLEKGQGDSCPTFSLLAGVRTLPSLVTLELVNFDVKPGFDSALARCQNVRRLLIIPTYISQSATTNHMVLGGVTKLNASLTHFVWGVTHELLRVTELFVDQCEDQKGPPGSLPGKEKDKKKSSTAPAPGLGAGDSIPVLRPVPGSLPSEDSADKNSETDAQGEATSNPSSMQAAVSAPGAPQVDILPLTKLQKMLTTALPNTKIKILKVPFQATWRQYISETDF